MNSLTDLLPPEIACQINPGWRKNEAEYLAVRDRLLGQYRDLWIGFDDGAVVASGTSPVAVFHAAEASGRNPFVTCVGREAEPCRMRRNRVARPYGIGAAFRYKSVHGRGSIGLNRTVHLTQLVACDRLEVAGNWCSVIGMTVAKFLRAMFRRTKSLTDSLTSM